MPVSEGPTAPTLRWAVRLLAAETVVLAGIVAFLLYEDIFGAPSNVRGAVLVTLYPAVFAALLGLLARALYHRRKWARGPAIVLQLLLVPLGYAMLNGVPWLGVPVMLVGLVGAGTLLAPATRSALGL